VAGWLLLLPQRVRNLNALEFSSHFAVFFRDSASGDAQSRQDFVTRRTHEPRRFG
jgi:hypothetical protein